MEKSFIAYNIPCNILLQGCGQVEEGVGGAGSEGDGGRVQDCHKEPRAAHHARLGEGYSYHATILPCYQLLGKQHYSQ